MDEYTSLRLIGKGSYGEVYLVKSQIDSKHYVLKRIKLNSLSEKEKRTAAQEARLLSELIHPNIVSYKDSFHLNGLLHILMSYCEGGDLNKFLKARNSIHLSESQIIHWFVQISLALQYLHKQNILHRDLKTQNIFLSRNIVKVGDLGIARVLESSGAMARTFIGTPYYMSPEIFQNMPYNHKSDIWALGCCVVEMSTLKTAFSAKDLNSLAFKIIVGKQPSIPDNYSIQLKQSHIKVFLQERQKRGRLPNLNSINRIIKSGKSFHITSSNENNDSCIPFILPNLSSDDFDNNSNSSLTAISSLQDTDEPINNTITPVSTYSTPRSHIRSQNNEITVKSDELCSTGIPDVPKFDPQPEHLDQNDSNYENIISNRDDNPNNSSEYLEYRTSEVVESEARQRRREQKRQQNYSSTLMNRYIRKSSRNLTQEESVVAESNQTVDSNHSESNKKNIDNISCMKLCNELQASIDSDEEKMLTLFNSTLDHTGTGDPINSVNEANIEDSNSREDKCLNESFKSQSIEGEQELSAIDIKSNIALLEAECIQGLGVSLFARSRLMLDKYSDSSEDLESNLKLILGQGKFEFYFTLLLKLKLYTQQYSVNISV
ncbi:Serine/threonine-protein kinase Nek4-like [Oopsacas minuta]|uniref:non-specific serine/threonine protein kinase n=1 Tax=Oopsacas minuta TaxID=111878 RepID=A0AAV7JC19_9METZ|nr:Serine/threonine-protein kinase Nek4-like [Oopsacas minuta]